MNDPFATNNKIGLPLNTPIDQTMLPVMCGGNGRLHGYIPIAQTTFDGTETTFTVGSVAVPVKSVTLPRKASDGTGFGVEQYMAAYWPADSERLRPWTGIASFIDASEIGYLYRHYMPSQGTKSILNRGPLVTNLQVGMAEAVTVPTAPDAPTVSNGALRWVASKTVNELQIAYFLDFNWVQLFAVESDAKAVRIEVVDNPASGEFKTALVATPSLTPEGFVEYNTLRILKLKAAAPGDYVFHFKVYDDLGQATPVTFTLTII